MGQESNLHIPDAIQAGLTVANTVFLQKDSNLRARRFWPPCAYLLPSHP